MQKPFHLKRIGELGYSLIEIMVTISIAAILAGVTIPTIGRVISVPPEGEQLERLRRSFNDIRNRTITADVCATAVINGNQITTTSYRTCGPPLADPMDTRTNTFTRLALDNFSNGRNTLEFNPGGGINSRQPVTLTITTTSHRKYEIKILPAIGNIRMMEIRQ